MKKCKYLAVSILWANAVFAGQTNSLIFKNDTPFILQTGYSRNLVCNIQTIAPHEKVACFFKFEEDTPPAKISTIYGFSGGGGWCNNLITATYQPTLKKYDFSVGIDSQSGTEAIICEGNKRGDEYLIEKSDYSSV